MTEKYPEKSKQGIYKLKDKFFTFWFKYIFPNRGKIEIGHSGYVLRLIKDTFEHYVSTAYEDVCLDLCKNLLAEGLMTYTSIGKWWSKNEEIDIVALDDNKKIACFCECKWSNKKAGEDVYRELEHKSRLVDWHSDTRNNRYILFSRSGFTEKMIQTAKKEKVLLVHGKKVLK